VPPAPPAAAARAAGHCRPRLQALPPLLTTLPPLPAALPLLPPPRVAAGLATGANGLVAVAACLFALAALAHRRRARHCPRPLAHAHEVLKLAVAHVTVVRPNLTNALGPQPVREHDDTG